MITFIKCHLISPFYSFIENSYLLKILLKRELLNKYQGSYLGIFWSILNPVALLLVYTFVFSIVLKIRWSDSVDGSSKFAVILFLGLLIFNFFSDSVNRASSLIVSNPNYVKKVVFPLEILINVSVFAALTQMLISFLVWVIAYSIFFELPNYMILFFPILITPLILYTFGFSWILSALGVYFKDLQHLTSLVVMLLLFGTPIFYPASMVPNSLKFILYVNPLASSIEAIRNALVFDINPFSNLLYVHFFVSFFFFVFGYFFFQRLRKGFPDIL